jgi:hypothetical protein
MDVPGAVSLMDATSNAILPPAAVCHGCVDGVCANESAAAAKVAASHTFRGAR